MTLGAESTSPTAVGGSDATGSDTGATTTSSSSTTEQRETDVIDVDKDENTTDQQGQYDTPTTIDATIDLTKATDQNEPVATTTFEALSDERRQEWKLVQLTKYVKKSSKGKPSPVYDHIYQISVDVTEVTKALSFNFCCILMKIIINFYRF